MERNMRNAPDLCGAGRMTVTVSDGARRRVRLVAEIRLSRLPLQEVACASVHVVSLRMPCRSAQPCHRSGTGLLGSSAARCVARAVAAA